MNQLPVTHIPVPGFARCLQLPPLFPTKSFQANPRRHGDGLSFKRNCDVLLADSVQTCLAALQRSFVLTHPEAGLKGRPAGGGSEGLGGGEPLPSFCRSCHRLEGFPGSVALRAPPFVGHSLPHVTCQLPPAAGRRGPPHTPGRVPVSSHPTRVLALRGAASSRCRLEPPGACSAGFLGVC